MNDGGDDVMINGYFGALAISNGLLSTKSRVIFTLPPDDAEDELLSCDYRDNNDDKERRNIIAVNLIS